MWKGEDRAWCVSGAESRTVRTEQTTGTEATAGRAAQRPDHGDLHWPRAHSCSLCKLVFTFILNAQKAPLADFKPLGTTNHSAHSTSIYEAHVSRVQEPVCAVNKCQFPPPSKKLSNQLYLNCISTEKCIRKKGAFPHRGREKVRQW